jgi:hypothetical protein
LRSSIISTNNIRIIKSCRVHIAHILDLDTRNACKILVGKPEGIGVNGKIILKWKCLGSVSIEFFWFMVGVGAAEGSFEHGNEPSGSIRGGEFLL